MESKETKLASLKNAVNGFIDSVAKQSPNSRIALVKFAGDKSDQIGDNTYYDKYYQEYYNCTQIVKNLTPASKSGELTGAVNKLEATGATRADYGMELAKNIINSSDVANNGRKKTVIMFTDGEPTDGTEFEIPVANAAISASKGMKDVGTTVYTIGVFSGANGTPVNSLDSVGRTNKYMHLVSSNYKNATAMDNEKHGAPTYPEGGKSYFLSAGSADELSNIFQQISQEVGGSTSNLDEKATIKDIVTPYFNMPTDVKDVEVYTAESNGRTDNTINWKDKVKFPGNVSIQGNTVSVSGFSYKENWCGPASNGGFHDGKKLIIQFTVTAKDGFLGGNDVPTNEGTSGIYDKDGEDGKMIDSFKVPTVNVPIKAVTVTAEDKNVYLLGDVTTDQLKTGAAVKCGDVELMLGEDNYGLQAWQYDYVKLNTEVKDAKGNALTNGYTGLTEDTTYTVSAKVSPKRAGTTTPEKGNAATEQTGQATGKINVFTPELTFKDSEAYYGAEVPDLKGNLTMTEWKHNGTVDTAATMTGEKPELTITCTPDADKVKDNKINTKQDVGVDVTVTLNTTDVTTKTTFQHTNCTGQTCTLPEGKEFLIHIKTCKLTIKKTGGKDNESYVFDVYKDGEKKYSEVTIWGNDTKTLYELPVGTYTIQEDTGWSWRFTPTYSGKNEVKLSPTQNEGSITCTNKQAKDKWINGFSTVVRNIFKKVTTK